MIAARESLSVTLDPIRSFHQKSYFSLEKGLEHLSKRWHTSGCVFHKHRVFDAISWVNSQRTVNPFSLDNYWNLTNLSGGSEPDRFYLVGMSDINLLPNRVNS